MANVPESLLYFMIISRLQSHTSSTSELTLIKKAHAKARRRAAAHQRDQRAPLWLTMPTRYGRNVHSLHRSVCYVGG